MSFSTFNKRGHQGGSPRAGFTLTELLIGITIIGLLAGLLTVVGTGAIRSSREFAVNTEIVQMSQAIEHFKSKYGFYPPSFEQFKRTVNTGDVSNLTILREEASQILPFLNKISPNHRELEPAPTGAAGRTRLMDWWENVGCNLDQTSSLQFWLSGLCANKQYPLTGGLNGSPYMPAGYGVAVLVDGTEITAGLARETFFDFDTERLVPVDIDNGGTQTRPVVQYIMDHGKLNGDLFYVYRDHDSYTPVAQPVASGPIDAHHNGRTETLNPAIPAPGYNDSSYPAYLASVQHRGLAYHVLPDAVSPLRPVFANPETFQLIAFGLDGDAGTPAINESPLFPTDADSVRGLRGVIVAQRPASDDNLCNFAGGRMDTYRVDNNIE